MLTHAPWRSVALVAALAIAGAMIPSVAEAQPVVKTVPWVPTNPLIPHDSWSGKTITLKGTANMQGAGIQWTWDFGDGSPVATGTVTDQYVIEATHAYIGAPGTVFTARLTVRDTGTGLSDTEYYYVAIHDKALNIEVNVAIDAGLWYLHKTMSRSGVAPSQMGWWPSGNAGSSYWVVSAANLNAFEVNGHVETGDPANPYVETVQRAMRWLFATAITTRALATQTNPLGTFNPDANGNGIGIYAYQATPGYETGIVMDAIVASGTPSAVAQTGPMNVIGRQYKDIVQDMADWYSYCQYDSSPGGAWRYNCNEYPDNSAAQWGAIGLIAAERYWGVLVPSLVKQWNLPWLTYSQPAAPGPGYFGYTSSSPIWGPYGTTPSGMVQLAMDGVGRGDTRWDRAETYIRDNFHVGGGATTSLKAYYYGLFAFTKAMLLHDSNNDGVAEPITMLQSSTAGVNPIDWYGSEASPDPITQNNTDGVARTLVNAQNAAGYWYGHNYDGRQFPLETAWAIMMLNRTLFAAGAPVAVAAVTPNPAIAGGPVILDGSGSFHQDVSKAIVSWDWDLDNNGTFDASGVSVTTTFAALGNYPVTLRVTDNAVPPVSATTTVTVVVSIPPLPPTADAGGPYNFCQNRTPWFLDGSGSTNPDDGVQIPGAPPDFITAYDWDLDGDGVFGDVTGPTPDVTGAFGGTAIGQYLIQLRVTDNTAAAFPGSGQPDLTDTDSAQVFVRSSTDPECACISALMARAKPGKADVYWPLYAADHINVYRGTVSGGPYLKIGSVPGTSWVYVDQGPLTNGVTYYYVVRPAALNNAELCQSNQAQARPVAR
jgi:hypothetical protein